MKSNVKIVVIGLALLGFLVLSVNFFVAVLSGADRFVSDKYDKSRERIGLPVMSDSFEKSETDGVWLNTDTTYPQHALKELQFNYRGLKIERDDFIARDSDGNRVTIMSYYHYRESCFNFYLVKNKKPGDVISCTEANNLLKELKLDFQLLSSG